jgi:hypothetical protein
MRRAEFPQGNFVTQRRCGAELRYASRPTIRLVKRRAPAPGPLTERKSTRNRFGHVHVRMHAFGSQDKKEAKKEPTAAQKAQQERMKSRKRAGGREEDEGDARKKYMSACLKGEEKMTPQQARMKQCNKQASDKKMSGDDRKKFMNTCLKG